MKLTDVVRLREEASKAANFYAALKAKETPKDRIAAIRYEGWLHNARDADIAAWEKYMEAFDSWRRAGMPE